MATLRVYNISGINLAVQPLLHKEGDLLRSVNVENFPIGAKRKRPGYITYLGTANGSQVNGLFNWTRNNGTQFWNYRFSGGLLYSSQQGTGAWTITGNGTWVDIGDTKDGVVNYHFPQGSRSKLLFWKVYDNSATARYNFYGLTIDYDLVQRR